MTEAAYRKAVAEAMEASKSLARRRLRLIQAKKRSFDPPSRQRGEANLAFELSNDLDEDGFGGLGEAFAGVGAVGERQFDEGESRCHRHASSRFMAASPGHEAVSMAGRTRNMMPQLY